MSKTSFRLFITCDWTGVNLWRRHPKWDAKNNVYYGGEMLRLPDLAFPSLPMDACLPVELVS